MRPVILPAVAAAVLAAALCGCSSSAPSAPAAHASSAAPRPPKPSPSHSAGCALKTTFDYIERDDDPGAGVLAQEVGNVDLVNCTTTLSGFAAQAGQGQGECTTIAKASDNPGYDVNASPAPPLKDVIASAGPGCS